MSRYVVMATWDDVPHLTEQAKNDLLASISPHQRDARSKGIPTLGSGAIYPIAEDEIKCEPFKIPDYFQKAFGIDVGWNKTAAIWGAKDVENDVIYLYSEHYRGKVEPAVHAAAIRARGAWIRGAIDYAGTNQDDGTRIMHLYEAEGLKLEKAVKAVEAGILEMFQRLSTGRLKVFSTLQNWFAEYRLYRRDEKGKIVKQNDHLLDATRYMVMTPDIFAHKERDRHLLDRPILADMVAGY